MKSTTKHNNRVEADAADVWHVRLDDRPVDRFLSVLVCRAESLGSRLARRKFILGRVKLRQILGRCCGVEPAAVPIYHSALGKPYLGGPFSETAFNFSHSGGLALVALSRRVRIGIDLEDLRFSLHHFRITVAPKPAEVVTWPEIRNLWKLYDLPVPQPYVAAIASDRTPSSIGHLEFE